MEIISSDRVTNGHTPSPALRHILRSDAMNVVLAVAELKSVRGAAEAVGLTPSAVSKHVRRIEEQLGRELFVRAQSGLEPNAEGEIIAGFARRFLELADEMGAHFDRDLVAGRVRLGVTDDVGLAKMPTLIQRCNAIYPGLRIELTVAHSSELRDLMAAQTLDLALLSDGGFELPSDAIELSAVPLVWVSRIGWKDHEDTLPIAVSEEGCRWRKAALQALQTEGRSLDIRCTSKVMSGQLSAVRVGLAVAAVPAVVVTNDGVIEIVRSGLPDLPPCRLGVAGNTRANPAIGNVAKEIEHVFGVQVAE